MKLIRVLIYLSQFCLKIYYCFDKSNLISNVFNRLFNIARKSNNIDNLDIKSFYFEIIDSKTKKFYVFNQSLLTISDQFRQKIQIEYLKNKA